MSSTNDAIIGLAGTALTIGFAGEVINSLSKKKKKKKAKRNMEIF